MRTSFPGWLQDDINSARQQAFPNVKSNNIESAIALSRPFSNSSVDKQIAVAISPTTISAPKAIPKT